MRTPITSKDAAADSGPDGGPWCSVGLGCPGVLLALALALLWFATAICSSNDAGGLTSCSSDRTPSDDDAPSAPLALIATCARCAGWLDRRSVSAPWVQSAP
eukprot:7385382-Prymnesium_polylepis.1